MVSYADILTNNASLQSSGSGLTAVFVGATHGIGLGALRALTKHTDAPTIYVVGRSAAALNALIDNDLKRLNSAATVHPIQADDLTLLSNVDKACEAIKSHLSSSTSASSPARIDILCLSPGYLTLAGHRDPSPGEGLDRLTAIRYYARMRFVDALLPLLRAAPSPRVVSVLGGGKEGPLWADDFLLEREGHYSVGIAAGAAASMTTLFMEELAAQQANTNGSIVFVHLFPGLVRDTNLFATEHWGAVLKFVIGWIVLPLIRPFTYTAEEAGERIVFAATSGRFRKLAPGASGEGSLVSKGSDGKVGSGVYLVQADSSTVEAPKVLREMREQGVGAKLYEHTMGVFRATEAK